MKAALLLRDRHVLSGVAFVEMVVCRVPRRVPGSNNDFKLSLALIVDGACVLRYANEEGNGEHKHVGGRAMHYRFVDLPTMQADFWHEVETWQTKR